MEDSTNGKVGFFGKEYEVIGWAVFNHRYYNAARAIEEMFRISKEEDPKWATEYLEYVNDEIVLKGKIMGPDLLKVGYEAQEAIWSWNKGTVPGASIIEVSEMLFA